MLKKIAFAAAALVLWGTQARAGIEPETQTLFHACEQAWGVGTIHLSKQLTFRDGKLLAFPSQFTDLLWAPNGTKPRNMMLVHEVWPTDDKDKPFLQDKDDIFAPVALLPDHSYYKDNLPFTHRHEIAGGRRYVFRGEQIPEVRRILDAYLKAHDIKGMERFKEEVVAVAAALESTIVYVREDAVTWFSVFPTLARDFDERAIPSIKAYLAGPAPEDEKAKLIETLAAAKIDSLKPLLEEQAKRADASGAAALQALSNSGENETTDALLAKSRSSSAEVQAFALKQLGARADKDDAAFARCKEVLDQVTSSPKATAACIDGLAAAKGDRVRDLLMFVVERGDMGSRDAALAIAGRGAAEAEVPLTGILARTQGEPAKAAAIGLTQVAGCASCAKTLEKQHHDHPDESVRNLIGVLMGVPLVHKH